MDKEQAIKETGYSEHELIYIGLTMAKVKMVECRNDSDVLADWAHYNRLVTAYQYLIDEMLMKEVSPNELS